MAQFGGNKNPPWAQGGRGGPPGGGAGALDVPGLVGAFGAAAGQGPPVFQGTPTGLPPGLAGVGHLGVPGAGHGPAVTLAAMAGQPVRACDLHFLFQSSVCFFLFFLHQKNIFQFRVFIHEHWDQVLDFRAGLCCNSNSLHSLKL